jgi:hypothetical protein
LAKPLDHWPLLESAINIITPSTGAFSRFAVGYARIDNRQDARVDHLDTLKVSFSAVTIFAIASSGATTR